VSPLKQWRSWVLAVLLVGPVLAYVGLGTLWLWQHGWLILGVATTLWVIAGLAFALLAARWTRTTHPIMPPLDWDSPQTFTPLDRQAWELVRKEADRGEAVSYETLMGGELYIDTGRRLLHHLAEHYHPAATNPLDDVPLVELLTALELAAEDLAKLCRQVPGGDLITLSHWRRAVQVAGYISKANDLYSYLLPLISPGAGLARWGAREWITKPAWRSMQQNVLRWFYQAYVNRLGAHLVELLSGRLALGAEQYRRLTGRRSASPAADPTEIGPLTIAVAGARQSGKSRLIAQIRKLGSADPALLKARQMSLGVEVGMLGGLRDARWLEVPGYNALAEPESRRDRARRQAAVEAAAAADLLVLVVDARQQNHLADEAFALAWDRWFQEHPRHEVPPTLVVITGVDCLALTEPWHPPYEWSTGQGVREKAIRALLEALREKLPPSVTEFAVAGLNESSPFGLVESVLPALAAQWNRTERTALIRKLHEIGGQSRMGRLVRQLGVHGMALWRDLKARRKAGSPSS
jgi:hypothetical protein